MVVEDRLQQALADHASTIPAPPDHWDEIEARAAAARRTEARRRSRRRLGGITVLGVATAAAALIVLPALTRAPSHGVVVRPAHQPTVVTPQPATPTPTPKPTPAPASVAPAAAGSGYLPLYPFSDVQQATTWQAAYKASGAQPWHLDAGETAVNFAHYLGYADITNGVTLHSDSTGTHVTVHLANPNGGTFDAAVIHVRRFGTGPVAPWEVVGTDDTASFSVTSPHYGAVAGSPLAVGGAITGVDQNIRVEVLQLSSATPVGTFCCLPAGNSGVPWSASVAFHGAVDNVVIVAASTGGGLYPVSQFAVTGIRTRPGTTPGL